MQGHVQKGSAEEYCGSTKSTREREKEREKADSKFDTDKEEGEEEVRETRRAIEGEKMENEMW